MELSTSHALLPAAKRSWRIRCSARPRAPEGSRKVDEAVLEHGRIIVQDRANGK